MFLILAPESPSAVQLQPPGPGPAPLRDAPVRCEFRVFDGEEEVTDETYVRVFISGARDESRTIDQTSGHRVVFLPAGIWDVQAIHQRAGEVLSVKWKERLVITHYPDELNAHLEVINFRPRYGALQVASPDVGMNSGVDVAVFVSSGPTRSAAAAERRSIAAPIKAAGYRLFVVPAGRYDVRVKRTSAGPGDTDPAPLWLLDLDVQSDRTRLRTIDVGGAQSSR